MSFYEYYLRTVRIHPIILYTGEDTYVKTVAVFVNIPYKWFNIFPNFLNKNVKTIRQVEKFCHYLTLP